MILRLGKTNDFANVINKTIYDVVEFNILLKQTTDLISPELILSGVDLDKYNYCEIPELGRKYFIRSVTRMGGVLFNLSCECDYLETYKVQILASEAKLQRAMAVGDFGEVSLDETGKQVMTNYYSDVELVETDKAILSLVGGL